MKNKPYQAAGLHCQKLRCPSQEKEPFSVCLILSSSCRYLPTQQCWVDPRPDPEQLSSWSYISVIRLFPWGISHEQAPKPTNGPVYSDGPKHVVAASIHTWCRQPPFLDHGCRGSSPRDYTCRSGCSTYSIPSSFSSAWLDE